MTVYLATVGTILLRISLVVALYGIFASLWGGRRGDRRWVESGRTAAYVLFALLTAAVALLISFLVRSEFQVEYVGLYTERALPLFYKITAIWGGNAGSLLFWVWLLSLYIVASVFWARGRYDDLLPYAQAVMLFVAAFFVSVNVLMADPFKLLAFTPADGQGLNPLLQNYWMAFHPPNLYLGYVGFAIPFSFAMAALWTRKLDDRWLRATRRWTLISWMFLSIGIVVGGRWAYEELGWGGYWAWDPVENASFMPWLVGTAFLHSAMIQERRGMMKVWNMVLIILTFVLSLFGTFLTRSGIIQSVHAFANSKQSPYFLSFITLVLLGSLALMFSRMEDLKAERGLQSLVSRESSFLFNNVFFIALTFATFWGTTFPILSELFTGEKILVGPPFFNRINGPIFLAMLLLIGVCPVLGWGMTSASTLKRVLAVPLVGSGMIALALFLLGVHNPWALIGFTIAAFTGLNTLMEYVRGVQARRKATGEGWSTALWRMASKNRRRYGGYLVHIGVVLIAIGIVGSNFFQLEAQEVLRPGETMQIGEYTLLFEGLHTVRRSNHESVYAQVRVFRDGEEIDVLHPERAFFFKSQQPMTEVAVRSTPKEDLYIILAGWEQGGELTTLKVYVNPLTFWVWVGTAVLVLGTLFALWPAPEPAWVRRAVPVPVTAEG